MQKYRRFLVGNRSWAYFIAFELYNLVCMGLPTVLGFALRQALLPLFLQRSGRKLVIGRDVTLRQPSMISMGSGVIIDDSAVLDFRQESREGPDATAPQGIVLEDHVLVGRSSQLVAKSGQIVLKAGCNISSHCRIATQSRVTIGESTLIAAYVYIGPGNHSADNTGRPIIEQEMDIRGGVKIGKNCWIGARATVLDGVTIGDNAIVGAHALVREDVPENAIVGGVPARLIRLRTAEDSSGGANEETALQNRAKHQL